MSHMTYFDGFCDGSYVGWVVGFITGILLCYFVLYLPAMKLCREHCQRMSKK